MINSNAVKILVVDDEKAIRDVLSALQDDGFSVQTAENGPDGLGISSSHFSRILYC